MKLLHYEINNGKKNMQIDSDLLDSAIQNKDSNFTFRLYGWSPKCISLGRNQKDNFLQTDVDVVRRLTGGRALLHDNEVTYSCIAPVDRIPDGENIKESYKFISKILIEFFRTLGIELDYGSNKKFSAQFDYCMLISTGADVCYRGKKIIGSAQFRKEGYILQHGSILFDYNKELLENIFHEKVEGITTVHEILPDLSKTEFIQKLEQYLTEKDNAGI